jgi:RHS repeat-associated protein
MYDAGDIATMLYSNITGKEHDTETNIENFGARYDSSSMGRFMSPDWSRDQDSVPYAEFENPQTLNLYAFVQDNPTSQVDDSGHHEVCQTTSWINSTTGAYNFNLSCHDVPDNVYFSSLLGLGGHHFVDQALIRAKGAWDSLSGQFFRRWVTGPLKDSSVHRGFSTPHRLNSAQIKQIIEKVEQETGRDMKDWTKAEIEKAVGDVRSAEGDVKDFLDKIEAEVPSAQTIRDDISTTMGEAESAIGGVVQEIEETCAENGPNCGIPPVLP